MSSGTSTASAWTRTATSRQVSRPYLETTDGSTRLGFPGLSGDNLPQGRAPFARTRRGNLYLHLS